MNELDFRNDLLPLKDKLFRLALRILLDSGEAEDVVEDTLIRVWERRGELIGVSSIEAYSLTVCRNLALDRSEKREAQNVSLDLIAYDAPDTAYDAAALMEREEKRKWVGRFFDQLPEKQRTIMQLRDVEGKTYKEVAEILGISEEQVKVSLFRARHAIKEKFDKLDQYGL